MSDVARICSIITFHLSKLWKARFSILCDVIFLVRLQGEFWHWSLFVSTLKQPIEAGDAVEVKYSGSFWTNQGFGKVRILIRSCLFFLLNTRELSGEDKVEAGCGWLPHHFLHHFQRGQACITHNAVDDGEAHVRRCPCAAAGHSWMSSSYHKDKFNLCVFSQLFDGNMDTDKTFKFKAGKGKVIKVEQSLGWVV